MVNNCLHHMQNLLYPPRCLVCGARGQSDLDLCTRCHACLPFQAHACRRCAEPIAPTAEAVECPRCMRNPPPFESARAVLRYQPPADWLITQLKFHGRLSHARLLGGLLASAVSTDEAARVDCIIPMPLHRERLRRRGFNQAAEIARCAAARLGLEVAFDALRRVRDTHAQSDLPARKRRANVRGAFEADTSVHDRRVALLDDVITTGHTAAEAARTLKRAGARAVLVWSIARA